MKIVAVERTPERWEDRDYRQAYEIRINEERVFFVSDGEPEDSNLMRDFNDVYAIPKLLKLAYEAGKNGESLEISEVLSDTI